MPEFPSGGTDLQVFVNGSPVAGLLQASVLTSNRFSSDSYSLTFAMGPCPLGEITFWSTLSSGYVEIRVIPEYEPLSQTLISGMVDTIHINPIQRIVSIEGRDLSSALIDSYRQQDFVNQSASEIVSTVASYHGLTPVVTATFGNVGRYYGDGSTRLSLGQFSRLRSDWDLLVQLARENGFDVFVLGSNLFFQPSDCSVDIPVHIAFRDVKTIRFEQSLTIASNATAQVQSWDSLNMASYASDAADVGISGTQNSATANAQPFLFSASNLTSQQVTNAANQYTAELNRLGVVLHIEMPWDLTLSPRMQILIDESNSPFDTIYKIDSIERHYSTTSGSSQIVRAVVT